MSGTEYILVKQAQKGDSAAFRQLLEQHYALMHRVAWRFTGNAQDAEDVAQEVCVGLVHKLKTFRGDSSFSTWLYRVVVNACRDFQKKQGTHRSLEHRYAELEKGMMAEQDEANRKTAWLYRTLATLESSLKETALLVLAEELSHAEAGKILGCAEATVSWRMHEVRKQLKQAMDGYHGS